MALDAIDAAPKRRIVATMAWRLTPSTRPPNDTGTAPSDCGGPLGEDGQVKSWGDDASGDFDDDEWFDDKDGADSASVFVTPSS